MNIFEPSFDLIQEDDCNTLLLYLPGFTKEELRIQLTRSKVLKISGTRAIGDNRWSSFHKDFPVTENCDTSKISAKFEEGTLYIRQPKVIVPEHKTEDKITPPPTQAPLPKIDPPPKPAAPPAPKIDPPPKPAAPPAPKIDPPPKPAAPPAPKIDPPPKAGPSHLDEPKKQENFTEEKQSDESKKQGSVKVFTEEKKEEKQRRKDKRVKKITAGKSEKVSSGVGGFYSVVNGLKMEREKVMKIMMFVFAFALGMYVSNKVPNWFSRNV